MAMTVTMLHLGDKIIYEKFLVVNYQRHFRVLCEIMQMDKVIWRGIGTWRLNRTPVEGTKNFKVRFKGKLEKSLFHWITYLPGCFPTQTNISSFQNIYNIYYLKRLSVI